jgi:chloramphenicol-sensitive protein RarD
MNPGILYALGCGIIWGLFPVYFKLVRTIPATQLIGHRIAWSCIMLLLVIAALRQWKKFCAAIKTPRTILLYTVAAILLAINWLTFVWATNSNFLVEASLGYFVEPLITITIGVIFLHERMRPLQWLSLGIVGAGVGYLTFVYGSFPWISLIIAFSFGIYGAIKKIAPLSSLYGLSLETAILFLPAIIYLVYVDTIHEGAFLHTDLLSNCILVGMGVVTTVPLLMFAAATKRINLSLVGFTRYTTPSLQFLLGVLIYREPFTQTKLIGFCIIWLALFIFVCEGFWFYRTRMRRLAN